MSKEKKGLKRAKGKHIGRTVVKSESFNVFLLGGQFILAKGSGFVRFAKDSTMRKSGIFTIPGKGEVERKIYGRNGYVGAERR